MNYTMGIVTYDENVNDDGVILRESFDVIGKTSKVLSKAGCYIPDFNGIFCRNALPQISGAINNIISNREDFGKIENQSNWGIVTLTLMFLIELEEVCRNNPNSEIEIYRES